MVRALEARGHEVKVLTSKAPGETSSTRSVRRWPVIRDKAGAVRGYLQYASFDLPLFFRLLFAPRGDLIIVEPPPTTGAVVRMAGALKRTPYAYFAADVSSVAAEGIGVSGAVVAVLRKLEGWVLGGAHTVFTVSEGVSQAVKKLGAKPERTICVGTGIDTSKFSSEGPVSHSGRYFVYAGTMSEIQGASVFIDAFSQITEEHPDARLFMYGHGVEREELEERARPLGECVQFPGTVGAEELSAVLRGARAGLASVRPAKGYDFAYATKAFASLSCGSPVIYSGVGPMKELIVEADLGYSVPWSSEAVADAMRLALETEPSIEQRQKLAQWVEQHHSLQAVGARISVELEESVSAN